MSVHENLQGCLVNLFESLENLTQSLEEKHFGKSVTDPAEFEEISEDSKDQYDRDFLDIMAVVFEKIEDQHQITPDHIDGMSRILLSALDKIAPLADSGETEVDEDD